MLLIDRWLQGTQNFITGRNLYKLYGNNSALVKLLEKGETPYHKKLLKEALEEINTTGFKPVVKPVEVSIKVAAVMPEDINPVLNSIHFDWKKKYAEMKFYQHQLDIYGSDNSSIVREKCKDLCKRILDLEQEINVLWNNRDYYKEHGKLPETKKLEFIIPTDPFELAKTIESVKRSIRRNKAEAKQNPENPKYAALVEEYEEKLNQLKNATKKN